MSNFYCEFCGAIYSDSPEGYTTGCEHYPPDIPKVKVSRMEKISEKEFDSCPDGLEPGWEVAYRKNGFVYIVRV